jgi:hypothetical protein
MNNRRFMLEQMETVASRIEEKAGVRGTARQAAAGARN